MGKLKNTLLTGLIVGSLFSNFISGKAYSQEQDSKLNFYWDIKEDKDFGKHLQSWLCECPKEEETGNPIIFYFDSDKDGIYDLISVAHGPINDIFKFNLEEQTIDYYFKFLGVDDIYVLEKEYLKITYKEMKYIGEEFSKKVENLFYSQKDFSRFNTTHLEKFIREEHNHANKNYNILLEKILTEEDKEKLNDYFNSKKN